MLDFIKYTRFKFREHTGFCVPKGPNFHSAKKYTYRLQGSEVSFRAPTQYHFFRPGSEQLTSSWKEDNLERLNTRDIKSYDDTWASTAIFQRKYAFYGPWFTGEKARASLYIAAISPVNQQHNLNFLHPRAFEAAVAAFLTADYGHMHEDGSPDYLGPIDWEPFKQFPVPAARFKVESECWSNRSTMFCFPISSNRILFFYLSHNQSAAGSFEKRNAAISPKPAEELIDNIINSVTFTPSPELARELAEIRKSCPDLSVSKEFPPLKWPATVDETGLNIVEMNEKQRKALVG
ncbi:hypothetical protein [Microbulbifer mangrovi]|uniref:hypothetical protein n=1 Tax=Microbulbifer mangrovi TaxID=927787 RepID=UPI00099049A9|nr:hypothetical protein [Microbulbifer mangrovi]